MYSCKQTRQYKVSQRSSSNPFYRLVPRTEGLRQDTDTFRCACIIFLCLLVCLWLLHKHRIYNVVLLLRMSVVFVVVALSLEGEGGGKSAHDTRFGLLLFIN